MNTLRILFLLFLFVGCQSQENGTTTTQQPTQPKQQVPTDITVVDPTNILEYYLVLPIDFFSYTICGQKDSKAAREKAIKKQHIKNGYLLFDEECTGSPNEIVLFRDRANNKDVIALTKYHGDMQQTFHLLQYYDGEWKRIRDTHFPDDDEILNRITSQEPSYSAATKEALENAKEMDDVVSFDLLLPEIGDDIKVIINRELTQEDVLLATIKWTGSKFELK